jgi:hypothetical protein
MLRKHLETGVPRSTRKPVAGRSEGHEAPGKEMRDAKPKRTAVRKCERRREDPTDRECELIAA